MRSEYVLVLVVKVSFFLLGAKSWTVLTRRKGRYVGLLAYNSSDSFVTDRRQKEQPKVVIVGGGVGGLAVAARIASSFPCHVVIVEKNLQLGGRCGSFTCTVPNVGTFRHERGPSLLLLPEVYRDVFRECSGSNAEDYGLLMSQCIPAYQVIFDDGESIDLGFPRNSSDITREAEKKSRQAMDSYEVNGAQKWDEYMRIMSAFLDCGLPNFIEERFDILSFPAFLVEALRDFAKVRQNIHKAIQRRLTHIGNLTLLCF